MLWHRVRPSKRGFLTVPFALATALWGPAVLAATGGPAVAKVLTSCSFTALKNAVAAGGTVDYGVNCQSSPVPFTATITVPAGRTVDVEANGHSVALDGGKARGLRDILRAAAGWAPCSAPARPGPAFSMRNG